MDIPLLGTVTKHPEFDCYCSQPMPVRGLGGQECRFVLEHYDEDLNKQDFHAAIANFLAIDPSVLRAAEADIFSYYEDCKCDEELVEIDSPSDVWPHISLGDDAIVSRRAYGDRGVYVSLECNCDWEEEHGLQIVFKNGQKVNKVGPYDGHVTNSDAYADDALEDVVYRRLGTRGLGDGTIESQ